MINLFFKKRIKTPATERTLWHLLDLIKVWFIFLLSEFILKGEYLDVKWYEKSFMQYNDSVGIQSPSQIVELLTYHYTRLPGNQTVCPDGYKVLFRA